MNTATENTTTEAVPASTPEVAAPAAETKPTKAKSTKKVAAVKVEKAPKSATQSEEAKAKRAATVAKKRESKSAQRGYSLPLSLTCTRTGKTVKYTSAIYIEKCIQKAGSLENLLKTYVSREGRAQMRDEAEAAKKAAKEAKKAEKEAPAPEVANTPEVTQ